jgi:preprotein translocase subunit YajC
MTNLAFIFQGGLGGLLGGLMPFLLIFGVFYFLIIVPQRKRQKALADMVSTLKPGDKVITSGGIYATVKQVKDKSLLVMSADKSILEISRASVAGLQGGEDEAIQK